MIVGFSFPLLIVPLQKLILLFAFFESLFALAEVTFSLVLIAGIALTNFVLPQAILKFLFQGAAGSVEFTDALADAFHQFGYFFTPKKEQNGKEDDQHLRAQKIDQE